MTKKEPIICTSEYLRTTPKTAQVAHDLRIALDRLNTKHMELKNTADYWCRDYMPMKSSPKGAYVKYTYRPDYLWDYKTNRKFITDPNPICEDLNLGAMAETSVVMDGGNYVRCNDKIIMTDKVIMENAGTPVTSLLDHLEKLFLGEVVLLPWDMKDPCGHADGMVADLGNGKLLLNNFRQTMEKRMYKRLCKILEPKFDIVELEYDCKLERDSWCYLNYLRLPHGILLPCLSEKFECDNDLAAIETFQNLFPDLEIMPIYAQPLVKDGGAMHCVTWEYYESNEGKLNSHLNN